ncbi:MAG: DUF3024 domain-containing protein [Bacteroidetes bacterium]|nr:DUF3024 domain-containing protein [Bacteroidota bacterium]
MTNSSIDINEFTIRNYVESIRSNNPKIRKELDFGYTYNGKIAILHELRPVWNNPDKMQQMEFAKIRFCKSRNEWNLYWMRGSGKWELYDPFPKSRHLEKLIESIKEDKCGCFFG